jgi:hypothetical protein
MSLDQKDIELIERVIYKNGDDIAVSVARSFERLEERIDASESRLYSRIADVEEKVGIEKNDVVKRITDVVKPIATDVGNIADDLASLREAVSE